MKTTSGSAPIKFEYHSLRQVSAPEDQRIARKRYCGVAPAPSFLKLDTDENVRAYLGREEDGKRRKSTLVNQAIRSTIENNRDHFQMLNSGMVIVARQAKVDDPNRLLTLKRASIINGAQTRGVLEDWFNEHPEDEDYPSVNFELIVTDDEDLIASISIARNFQNKVADLSIYGREGRFDELERAMQRVDGSIRLRKRETDFDTSYLDTEKLIQVLTALTPKSILLPSADKRREKSPETTYRVYAYRHRARCLKDFAQVMDRPDVWVDAHKFFLDVACEGWKLYWRLKGEQTFSSLHCVKKAQKPENGKRTVLPDGVPDGIVFPILSALSRFARIQRSGWRLAIPKGFPWETLFNQAAIQEKTTANHNPQTMGKDADCYVALHGAIEMYFAVTEGKLLS